MDLNEDGYKDIITGCYATVYTGDAYTENMEGWYYVFWGKPDGTFKAAEVIKRPDGKPLIVEDDEESAFCTRPFVVDLDGDGKLDIVGGNFSGTFYFFKGKGKGNFDPKPSLIKTADGKALEIPHGHSDPCLADWDGDGDYDLFSGDINGGVYMSLNVGSKTEARFSTIVTVIKAERDSSDKPLWIGDKYPGPYEGTRVWVDDINGDGKMDILVGDNIRANKLGEGYTREVALKLVAEIDEKINHAYEIQEEKFKDEFEKMSALDEQMEALKALQKDDDETKAKLEALNEKYEALSKVVFETQSRLDEERSAIAEYTFTGQVWAFIQRNENSDSNDSVMSDTYEKFGIKLTVETPAILAPGDSAEVKLHVEIPEGFHIYGANDPTFPTSVKLDASDTIKASRTKIPQGKIHRKGPTKNFWLEGKQELVQPITISADAKGDVKLSGFVEFMVCDKKMCRPPANLKFETSLQVKAEVTPTSSDDEDADAKPVSLADFKGFLPSDPVDSLELTEEEKAYIEYTYSYGEEAKSTEPLAKSEFTFEAPYRLKAAGEPIKTGEVGYACPTLADVDGDGKQDLVVGQFEDGKMKFYRNVGTDSASPKFAAGQWIKTGDEAAVVPGVW